MYKSTIALVAVVLIFAVTLPAQNEFLGQPVQQDFQLSYWNVTTHGKSGYFELFDPKDPNAFVGIYDPQGTNKPSQQIVTVEGILGYKIPANQPYIVGLTMAQALYDNSPGEKWSNFGKHFGHGDMLSTAINGTQWNSYNENQFSNIQPKDMWSMVSGDPMIFGNWVNALPGLPQFMNEFSYGFAAPLGAGNFFQQIKPILPALPPSTSPGGGSLIGMNVVVQLGVLDTNGSTPAAPKFTLTNAIGIQAMAGPPIKLNAGSDGNWGPPLSSIDFRVENPNNSLRVDVPLRNGTTLSVPTRVIDGQRVALTVPRNAITGAIQVKSSTGIVKTVRQPLIVVTDDKVQDLNIVGTPQFTTKIEDDGLRIFGAAVTGTLNQITGKVLTIPVPSDFNLYDLEVKIYPLDRALNYAGLGTNVPINMAVAPVGALPIVGPVPTQTFAPDAVVLEECYENLSGQVDLSLSSNSGGNYDYLAVIRVVEKI